ncbi:alpha-amylase family glycosyl hydrolase [Nonomuraea ferruginea]
MSWRSLVHSWQLLDSHDTPRIRTVTGSRERHLVALGLQATLPGTPMVFAGSEFGLTGVNGEHSRTPPCPGTAPQTGTRPPSPPTATCSACAAASPRCATAGCAGCTPTPTAWCSRARRTRRRCSCAPAARRGLRWPCPPAPTSSITAATRMTEQVMDRRCPCGGSSADDATVGAAPSELIEL